MAEQQTCYQSCNNKFNAWDPKRIFCKKGCDSDEDNLQKCKAETCSSLCIRSELGDDNSKLGKWSSFFSRAPSDPKDCLSACIIGCNNKTDFDDDDD
ncbi:hypothetical protein TTHERM_00059270 (macronuclear) [Tetrahymena thermophila SB210]|uniref:Uncharacterized protein n=1 Tax=Tetrahymena thermophila (strain SB210) TaxID=312017 RepID=I7MDE2_TETTS|nr:hypothetical protein TTHERM_00059270 [Tetrahymena thermophila SB210]EAR87414.2 hypothetical protein TTHERM_00059270 [Tetrahymena thermophila SB210]|eukprot:XP_001007659.2 hypothetical protein TTHERM_00059270 [Tetrahymena thermophila SB210]